MTRELKLALVVGVMLVLVVAMLVADHVRPRPDTLAAARGDYGKLAYTGSEYGQADPTILVPDQQLVESQPRPEPKPEPKPIGPGSNTHRVSSTGGAGMPIDNYVKINQGSAKTEETADPIDQPEADIGLPLAGPDLEYKIEEGDTFFALAKRFYRDGGLHEKLQAYNKSRLGKQGQLKIDSTILVPAREVLEGKAISGSAANAQPKGGVPTVGPSQVKPGESGPRSISALAETNTVRYTIRPGDTLIKIARERLKSPARLREILDLNPKLRGNESSLMVGTVIKLPKE